MAQLRPGLGAVVTRPVTPGLHDDRRDGFNRSMIRYGHDAGDEVLRQLSRQLRDTVRTDDVVCRLGGDEFLIICPGTALEGALQASRDGAAGKFRNCMSRWRWR